MANIIKTKRTDLKGTLSPVATSLTVDEFVDHKNEKLEYSDFGGEFVVVVEQGQNIEMILIDGITQNPDGTATLSIATDGRHIDGKPPYSGHSTGLNFTTGASVIVSNDPLTLKKFANTSNDNTFEAKNTFKRFPEKDGVLSPTSANQFATKEYVDNIAMGGSLTLDQQVTGGVAGEDLAKGNIVYFKEFDQKWYKATSTDVTTYKDVQLGIVQSDANADAQFNVLIGGVDKTRTTLTAGNKYYLSDTAGQISTTQSETFLGWALEDDAFLFAPNAIYRLNYNEKKALETTYPLSENNLVIDEGSVTNGATYTNNTIAFNAGTPATITDSNNGFITAGFQRGQEIIISGSVSNDGTYRVKSVSAGTIELHNATLTDETAGADVTIEAKVANKILSIPSDGIIPDRFVPISYGFVGMSDQWYSVPSTNSSLTILEETIKAGSFPTGSMLRIAVHSKLYWRTDYSYCSWVDFCLGSECVGMSAYGSGNGANAPTFVEFITRNNGTNQFVAGVAIAGAYNGGGSLTHTTINADTGQDLQLRVRIGRRNYGSGVAEGSAYAQIIKP